VSGKIEVYRRMADRRPETGDRKGKGVRDWGLGDGE